MKLLQRKRFTLFLVRIVKKKKKKNCVSEDVSKSIPVNIILLFKNG